MKIFFIRLFKSLIVISILFLGCSEYSYYLDEKGKGTTTISFNKDSKIVIEYLFDPAGINELWQIEDYKWKNSFLMQLAIYNKSYEKDFIINNIELKIYSNDNLIPYKRIDINYDSSVESPKKTVADEILLLFENNCINKCNEKFSSNCYRFIWYVYDADKIKSDKLKMTLKMTVQHGEEEFIIDKVYNLKRTQD